ncbi:hypothetical protein F0562_019291 [Nyssa sinensis]|uniref:Uncharacterized protein n=1 Tax=Nyssa sinensis TaxID=561372 RepID=A0A5J4ZEQ3_9ASTE|nr:hypothetical protein F0562_019291 [Nyssa sinensis]
MLCPFSTRSGPPLAARRTDGSASPAAVAPPPHGSTAFHGRAVAFVPSSSDSVGGGGDERKRGTVEARYDFQEQFYEPQHGFLAILGR